MELAFVTVRLAVGSQVTGPADVTQLAAAGITHVIDLIAGPGSAALWDGSGIAYLHNGTDDDGQPKPASWFGASIGWALAALADPGYKVCVFCGAGQSRSPSAAYAILRAFGLAPETAATLIRAARPQAVLTYSRWAEESLPELGYW
jgi:hypothetical protein